MYIGLIQQSSRGNSIRAAGKQRGGARMATTQTASFASLLRQLRTEAGLTQEELGERAHLSARGISDLERGVRTTPRPYTLSQLGDALGLGPAERARFERAAATAFMAPHPSDAPPHGRFLGAIPDVRLVAREREVERFSTVLDSVTEGDGHFLLLAGEPGSGKTRLLQELILAAGPRGFSVLRSSCFPSEQLVDYSPFLEAMAGLPSTVPISGRTEAERGWKVIQRLTQNTNTGNTEGPDEETIGRQDVAAAIGDTLLRASKHGPVALVVDDIEWADTPSLKVLQYLARVTRGSRVLLAGAFCDVRLTDDHPTFAGILHALAHDRLAEQVTPRRLSLDETALLVAELMGQDQASEEFAAFVYRRTKGIPGLVDAMVWSLGGRLELQGEIGSGSTGRVFRAYDRRTDQIVAAKLVLAREGIDLSDLLRFQREGAVLASLDHPNIVGVYDTFAEEHAACIIMELLDGESLAKILKAGPIPLARAKAIGLQTAEALGYAHSQSIVHRDIKPDNVMVLADDRVKITDFGIARILRTDNSLATIATTGMRAGTPSYMAPEQIAGKPTDGRADVYALGAMLFHMVAGRPPFEGPDKLSIAVKHLQDAPAAPSSIKRQVPADWDALILKALQKEPSRRFQTAHEMGRAVSSLKTEDERKIGATKARWQRLRAGAAAAALALLLVVAFYLNASTTSARASLSNQLNSYFSALSTSHGLSGTVMVAQHGKILLDQGYGFADRAARIPNRADSQFGVGGVTPVLSSTEILSYAARGALRLDDPICKFLPRCPASWKVISVRMLLDGTSNIPYPDNGWGTPGNSVLRTLINCQSAPLDAKPGSRMDYNGYTDCDQVVMGFILQTVSNTPWNQSGVFNFRGMSSSGQLSNAIRQNARWLDYQAGIADPNVTYDDFFAAYSTASDVYAFDNDLFDGKLLSPPAMKLVFTPRARLAWPDRYVSNTRWGYIWRIANLFGRRVIYTLDGLNDFQTVNMRFPRDGLTIIVLSNNISTDLWDAAVGAAAVVFHVRLARPRPLVDAPHELLGTYRRILRNSDRIKAHDPGLKSLVGQTFTLDVGRRVVSLNSSGGEYFQATREGMMTFLGYTPTNSSSWCSTLLSETPPTGYYHWSLHKKTLTIRPVRFDTCQDRMTLMPGVWTRVS
jgi:serine/threonine protein kinase/transcriptional regulator with XRE-family HTH domain